MIAPGWRLILREIVNMGPDLHSLSAASLTPFTSLFDGFHVVVPKG